MMMKDDIVGLVRDLGLPNDIPAVQVDMTIVIEKDTSQVMIESPAAESHGPDVMKNIEAKKNMKMSKILADSRQK